MDILKILLLYIAFLAVLLGLIWILARSYVIYEFKNLTYRVKQEKDKLAKSKEKKALKAVRKNYNKLYECSNCNTYFRGYQYLMNYYTDNANHSCPHCTAKYDKIYSKIEPELLLFTDKYENIKSDYFKEISTDSNEFAMLKNSLHSPYVYGEEFESILETITTLASISKEKQEVIMLQKVNQVHNNLDTDFYSNLNENISSNLDKDYVEIKQKI